MLTLLIASTTYLFTCSQADDVISNVYQSPLLSNQDQSEIIGALLEATPPECSAHFYDE